nr:DUF3168 domain-containing protein [uncultured Bacteroides sp.]
MSISIGIHIYEKLKKSAELTKLVGEKIYPLSTKKQTTFPFIIYSRTGLTPNETKDRYGTGDNVSVEVVVADSNYLNSISIAETVRVALEHKKGKYGTFDVIDAKLMACDEVFIEETYIQRLTFSFETEPNI